VTRAFILSLALTAGLTAVEVVAVLWWLKNRPFQ
jgi:hypothetical protein